MSSSAAVVLASLAFGLSLESGYVYSMSLHLASGLAALTVYWGDAIELLRRALRLDAEFRGYAVGLAASLAIGFPLYKAYVEVSERYGAAALLLLSFGLFATSAISWRLSGGAKSRLSLADWATVGVLQGLSALPGLSRSGLTIGYLCIRGYSPEAAVRASMLLGIPALLGAGTYSTIWSGPQNSSSAYAVAAVLGIAYAASLLSAKLLAETSKRLKPSLFSLVMGVVALVGGIALVARG